MKHPILKRLAALVASAGIIIGGGLAGAATAAAKTPGGPSGSIGGSGDSIVRYDGCQSYYPANADILLATATADDTDCWNSGMVSKQGRTFYGWSETKNPDTMDEATLKQNTTATITMPAAAKTVYAQWAINPTLHYEVNNPKGTAAPAKPGDITDIPWGTAATDKSGWSAGDKGKIGGWTFQGWYTSSDGTTPYDWKTLVKTDTTVYAKWSNAPAKIVYQQCPADGSVTGSTPDTNGNTGDSVQLAQNGFTRPGYTFQGWSKTCDNGNTTTPNNPVKPGTPVILPPGTTTYYPVWNPDPASVHYEANPPTGLTAGGTPVGDWTGKTGDTATIKENTWTVDGYTFNGWNTKSDGSGDASHGPGTTWKASGTLTLYAQWTAGEASLNYAANPPTGATASGKTDPQPGRTGQQVNVRANGFTIPGYTFSGWNTDPKGQGKTVNPNDVWTLKGTVTLYAQWTGVKNTLTYKANPPTGATADGKTDPQSGSTGDTITTRANGFTVDGYTFVRWNTKSDNTGTPYGEGKNGVAQYVMQPSGNVLYAQWKADPAKIVYKPCPADGVSGSTPDTTGTTGQTVQLAGNGFTRPGYTFTGWTSQCGQDTNIDTPNPEQPGKDIILPPGTTVRYPVWTPEAAHIVYKPNKGAGEDKQQDGKVGQTVKTLANPFTRDGYTFNGWNTDPDGKGTKAGENTDWTLTANPATTPKNTVILYAQWTLNKAGLNFDPNGGTGDLRPVEGNAFQTVTIPDGYEEPKVSRPGYKFQGWSPEKDPADKSPEHLLQPGTGTVTLPANGSTTVYAQWTPILTTLPFTGGRLQVPLVGLWAVGAGLAAILTLSLLLLGVRAGSRRTGRHMPTQLGRHRA